MKKNVKHYNGLGGIGSLALVLAWLLALSFQAGAQSYTWVPTTAGSTYDWNNTANWDPNTGFPDGAGQIASLTNNIAGDQGIRLLANRTLGSLNIGDADGSHKFSINSGSGTNILIFDSGTVGVAANLNPLGTNTNTISTGVTLNSDLIINMGSLTPSNTTRLSFTGSVTLGDRSVTITGSGTYAAGNNGIEISGASGSLSGSADSVVTNNSVFTMRLPGSNPNFLGTIVLNGRANGSNTGTLGLGGLGSIANAKEVVVNGYLVGGDQMGGSLVSGDSTSRAANPGQRLTQNTITLNGGSLIANGQPLDTGVLDRLVKNDVNVLDVNSGYSLLSIASSTSNGGSKAELNVTTLERGTGASLFVRGSQFDNFSGTTATFFKFANSSTYLKGAGGAADTATRSIVPWMLVNNTNPNAASGDQFATYDAHGARALRSGEYSGSITAGADYNVSVGSFSALASDATINALRLSGGSVSEIGTGRILTINSGGLLFTSNGGGLGGSGSLTAGTVNFGTSEAVIWANGSNTNTIGAVIDGSGGLTKAGSGTLILTGQNSYTGATHVGGGKLQVGDGTNASNLGVGTVLVAGGALLDIRNDDALSEGNILRLTISGLVNGSAFLAAGTESTVGGLYFGDALQAEGTWGSSTSGATFVNDTYFSGTGILTVVPEPSVGLLVLGGLATFLVRRRFRRTA